MLKIHHFVNISSIRKFSTTIFPSSINKYLKERISEISHPSKSKSHVEYNTARYRSLYRIFHTLLAHYNSYDSRGGGRMSPSLKPPSFSLEEINNKTATYILSLLYETPRLLGSEIFTHEECLNMTILLVISQIKTIFNHYEEIKDGKHHVNEYIPYLLNNIISMTTSMKTNNITSTNIHFIYTTLLPKIIDLTILTLSEDNLTLFEKTDEYIDSVLNFYKNFYPKEPSVNFFTSLGKIADYKHDILTDFLSYVKNEKFNKISNNHKISQVYDFIDFALSYNYMEFGNELLLLLRNSVNITDEVLQSRFFYYELIFTQSIGDLSNCIKKVILLPNLISTSHFNAFCHSLFRLINIEPQVYIGKEKEFIFTLSMHVISWLNLIQHSQKNINKKNTNKTNISDFILNGQIILKKDDIENCILKMVENNNCVITRQFPLDDFIQTLSAHYALVTDDYKLDVIELILFVGLKMPLEIPYLNQNTNSISSLNSIESINILFTLILDGLSYITKNPIIVKKATAINREESIRDSTQGDQEAFLISSLDYLSMLIEYALLFESNNVNDAILNELELLFKRHFIGAHLKYSNRANELIRTLRKISKK